MDDLNILIELNKTHQSITDAEVERTARHLTPEQAGDRPIGVVHSYGARAMWAVAERYSALGCEAITKGRFASESMAEEAELAGRALFCKSMEELARNAFWVEARQDLGAWDTEASVGIRSGWMLVHSGRSKNPILELLKGFRVESAGTEE